MVTEEEIAGMIAQRRGHWTLKRIAQEYGYSEKYVHDILEKYLPDAKSYSQNYSVKTRRQAKNTEETKQFTSGKDLYLARIMKRIDDIDIDLEHIKTLKLHLDPYLFPLAKRVKNQSFSPKSICAAIIYLTCPVSKLKIANALNMVPYFNLTIKGFHLTEAEVSHLGQVRAECDKVEWGAMFP